MAVTLPFADRRAGGRALAPLLRDVGGEPVVLGLPRGGLPVADEIAEALAAPLDVYVVRKLGLPGHEELAMGAVASGGVRVVNPAVLAHFEINDAELDAVTAREMAELRRRQHEYRAGLPPIDVAGRVCVLVDDGLATGATMRAALLALARLRPAKRVVAVPVAAADTCWELEADADEVVCLATPHPFGAVGAWYRDFWPISDQEVRSILRRRRTKALNRAG